MNPGLNLLPVQPSGAGSRWHLADLLRVLGATSSVREGPSEECAEFVLGGGIVLSGVSFLPLLPPAMLSAPHYDNALHYPLLSCC